MDYEDYIKLTPEQTQDWYRENKRDTQRLGEEITQFLRWLCERNSTGEYRDHNGMWNCQSWLLPALSKNGITHKHMQARGHLAETVTFEVNDATLSIAEYDVSLHTMHHEETEDNEEEDDAPHFLGTVLELNLNGSTPSTNFRLGLRWFAYDNETAGKGMTLDDFYQRRWAFPAPVWCHMLGNNDHARTWLTLTKLGMKN
ncbi:hypothetical protein OKC48_04110 [Methylorubrum extorquens]|uniref:hypothetical protein n=1 Tax=Methylorubrum extorquens TaxID=408 RepID=UPI0022375449|nr:hypothetical protein [Methylorubrum extorquens]UYW27704.1 hypothetical protein OKC48_04110 [Methylorubrum extorquens]